MPIDENPLDALNRQLEREDAARSPVPNLLTSFASLLPLPGFLDKVVGQLKDYSAASTRERIDLLVKVVIDEIKRHETKIGVLEHQISPEEEAKRIRTINDLLLDATRRASSARATSRVRRIATILANGTVGASQPDADEIEEMMRIAMELTDSEVDYLRELMRVQGSLLERVDYIKRHSAHDSWKQCRWGERVDNEVESAFSKMSSYGLVSRIPPPNNLNITADFPNRYVLLKKGLRFVDLIQQRATGPD